MFFTGDGAGKFFVDLPVARINAAVTDHLIMLFRDVADETLDELHDRDCLFHIFVILVTVIMEGNKVAIIVINSGGGNDGTAQITTNIFNDSFWVAFARLGIDIKTIFMLPVAAGLYFFERWSDQRFHFVQ